MRPADLTAREALAAQCPPGFAGEIERWADASRGLAELGVHPDAPIRAFFVPGRLELVGKHTDYAGGSSLVAATAQGFHLALAARSDRELRLHDAARARRATLDLAGDLGPRPGHWTSYALAVARRARRDFALPLAGADVAFTSTLPPAAGMASSSALVIAAWLALAAVNPLAETPAYRREIADRERLAEYLGAVEAGRSYGGLAGGEGVGTAGGSQDHVAILCGRAGRVSLYSYAPVRREGAIELPAGLTFAVAASGVAAKKTGGARRSYNRAARRAAELAELWRRETGGGEPHLAAILARGVEAREELARLAARAPGGELTRRLEHFVAESVELVPAAGERLAAGDLAGFGRLVDRSRQLADRLLANQTPETRDLAATARRRGALAASGFGAGFGGAVWALIETDRAPDFLRWWREEYRRSHPARAAAARFFATRPGPGAFEL